MKTPHSTSKKLIGGLFAALLGLCSFSAAHAQLISIDFNSLDFSNGPVEGTALDNFFAGYGITLTNNNPSNTTLIIYDNDGAGIIPPYLKQNVGNNEGVSFTMNFSQPVSDISFDRAPTGNIQTYPQWSVTAFSGATNLGSVGAGLSWVYNAPAENFTLNYNNITSLTLEADNYYFAGLGAPLLNNFTYTQNGAPSSVPEPSTWAMLLGGLGMLFFGHRRKLKA